MSHRLASFLVLALAAFRAPSVAAAPPPPSAFSASAIQGTEALPDSTAPFALDGADTASSAARAPVDSVASSPPGAVADTARPGIASPEPRLVDYLWVVRSALVDRASIDSIVARARVMGVRGLLVQVVGRGDAWYRSDLLPRPEALGRASTFDPLGELLARARPVGLEVHAWMNCMLVWSAPSWPRDQRHVLNEHPEWVTGLKDGRRMSQLSETERKRLAVEGVFLSPAHPRVRTWLANVAQEIVERYPVDGIHLDYIRQPDIAVGFDHTTRARFAMETGVDPERMETVGPAERASLKAAWREFQRRQVTLTVREVRDSIDTVRSGLLLSAAVIADTLRAERDNAQGWREWVRDSVIDRVFLMCYAPSVQTVMDQLLRTRDVLGASDQVVPGIAVFNSSASAAALKIMGARTLGYPLVALYSYDSLYERPSGWVGLRDRLGAAHRARLERGSP